MAAKKNEKENHKKMTCMVYREKKQQLLVKQCKFSAVLFFSKTEETKGWRREDWLTTAMIGKSKTIKKSKTSILYKIEIKIEDCVFLKMLHSNVLRENLFKIWEDDWE